MRITVFGASGEAGRQVVARAREQGHHVVAVVHSNNPFTPQDRIVVRAGDVTNTTDVTAALDGSDAVISTLGGFGRGGIDVLTTGMRAILPAMHAVAPGATATESFLDGKDAQTIDRLAKAAPLERLGTPQDIAEVVAFLASPAGHWVNGQVVRANGGMI